MSGNGKCCHVLLVACVLCLCTLNSCTYSTQAEKTYSNVTLNIPKTADFVNTLDSVRYRIDKVIELELKDGVSGVKGNPVIRNERIYIKDITGEYVAVFNIDGQFLHKVGGRGRSRNELVGCIWDFDIDRETDDVHIYDRNGLKILVFDRDGRFRKSISLKDCLPTSVRLASNSYIASCDVNSLREYGPKLVRLGESGEIADSYIEDERMNKITFEGANTIPLFSDGSDITAYLPLLSDSIVNP
mgnify:FL=1